MVALTFAATVHISVLGSFHPVQFELEPARGVALMVETQGRTQIVEGTRVFRVTGSAHVTGRNGSPVRFSLGIPGGMHREYLGKLAVTRQGGQLQAVVEMDLETAVASIVEAEGAPGLPFEARKAQAVVTRSYLLAARNRHTDFEFCDTEHCQLLREPPAPTSDASRAAAATRGQVIVYNGEVLAALYSANCGGHTKTLKQSKWSGASIPQPGYPYFAVACPLRGHSSGHGVGLCQMGAIYIAEHGYSAPIILHHYFPETTIETIHTQAPKPQAPHARGVIITRAKQAGRAMTASADMGGRAGQ